MNTCQYCQSPSASGYAFCCRACEILYSGNFQLLSLNVHNSRKEKWAAFDSDEVRQLYRIRTQSQNDRFRFYINGIQCASCVHLLEKIPDFNKKVVRAETFFGSSELLIECKPELPLSELFCLIEELGYTAQLLKENDTTQDNWKKDSRQWLKEIAVAGACAGNIMMFAIPIYSGVEPPYRQIFLWLSFALFLPVIVYSAQSIYKGAWRALRTRQLNTDLALTIALWGGFVLSTYNLVRGRDDVYFDSTASFLFLILVSRYFVKKVQRQTLLNLNKQETLWETSYLRQSGHEWRPVLATLLQPGDHLLLKKNQSLPCDSIVLDRQSEWDSSLTTGEVLPRVYAPDMQVMAGNRLLSEECRLQVVHTHDKSELQQMLTMISRQSLSKSHFILKMDVWSQRLLVLVFVIGLLFLALYSLVDVETALQRTLALWIVACPCALAFAAPLTLYKALVEARKQGLLIKNADVLEKAKHIKKIIFDKTGTLTTGHLQLIRTMPPFLPQQYKDIILSLEKNSQHPIAFAFRKAWPEGCQLQLQISDVYEVVGEKVYGVLDGKLYSLKRSSASGPDLSVELLENNHKIAQFDFKDELFADTAQTVQKLQKDRPCYILSGDTSVRVASLAQDIQVPVENTWAEHTPLKKWETLKLNPQSLMVGDGANDAAALQEAFVSVACLGSLEISSRVSDIYLLKKGLSPIQSFLEISQRYQFILKRNFLLAVSYNTIAGICALMGFINPLVAAILMPLSSLLLLFSTMKGWS
jgi:Cu2+-exporting ATPase/Cu+-exporting ATPase